ncbi:acyl carrier protein phosphodiesterase [Trichlorobacter ammonificans]|uniref:Acyl carrier protein phosphodiesterase n=1 Tax=Trichlorobacter ammonificans TaxID=2916410 RepID=A0ABM9D4T2_9BACT|nr:ACP phosphodiesterase [Trichlorobacter ammonificans]CAH2030263.1 Acyl carrier protein phosphodiesterase [Trichlorobacter ammonificans]
MNFLFHMLLSGADEQVLVGNFMGDFVKGPLEERFPERVRLGVALHRRIDSHADTHPAFRRSRQLLAAEYGRYRGIMLDLFCDYFLANDWQRWSPEPLPAYLARTRGIIDRHLYDLPPEMRRLVPTIFEELLPSYGTIEGIGGALARMSARLSRPNPLKGGERELRRHHGALHDEFSVLAADLFAFAGDYLAE